MEDVKQGMLFQASAAVEAQVLERREDGSGRVRLPIIREHQEFDYGLTAGGGGQGAITLDMLREMAANFAEYPGPVPIGRTPHVDFGDRGGPAPGFIEGVSLRGPVLWGDFDLGPELFRELVVDRSWRGFSVEATRDLELPARKFTGWTLTGGVFTNRPSTDVHFKIAADAQAKWSARAAFSTQIASVQVAGGEETKDMDEKTISLDSHEARVNEVKAELAVEREKVSSLQMSNKTLSDGLAEVRKERDQIAADFATVSTERDALKATKNQVDAQLKAVRDERTALQTSLNESAQRYKDLEERVLAGEVTKVRDEAISTGVPPAYFDGLDADPASWMKSQYASLEAFTKNVQRLKGMTKGLVKLSAPTASGSDPNADNDPEDKSEGDVKLSDAEKEIAERLGLDGTFAGVSNEHEARKRFEARQKEKAKG